MTDINLKAVDADGAIREAAEEGSGDTRLSFLRRPALPAAPRLAAEPSSEADLSGARVRQGHATQVVRQRRHRDPQVRMTLEYLERAFYDEATTKGKITDPKTKTFLKITTRDERNHVAFLEKALGHKAVKEPKFNFQGIPATRPSSPRPPTCSRTPACTPTWGRPATSRPRPTCSPPLRSSRSKHATPGRSDR